MDLVEHKQYKGMFFLKWEDGSLSDDFYNKTWANQHLRDIQSRIDATMPFKRTGKLTGEFK